MSDYNRITLVGKVITAPEVIEIEDVKKAEFNLEIHKTESIPIICFGNLAELANTHLEIGSRVFVEGKLELKTFINEGKKVHVFEVRADNIQPLKEGM